MYVYTYVCVYVCVYVSMYGCMYVCMYICMYACMHLYQIYICIYIYTCCTYERLASKDARNEYGLNDGPDTKHKGVQQMCPRSHVGSALAANRY